jgi:hypothetical protein
VVIRTVWETRHGDTSRSPMWAVLDDHGQPVDLTVWVLRAQLRPTYTAPVDYTFTVGDGIDLGTAWVQHDGMVVQTSTVQLYLDPADWATIPRPYAGVLDVEMASDVSGAPAQVFTLVECSFTATADVTRVVTV